MTFKERIFKAANFIFMTNVNDQTRTCWMTGVITGEQMDFGFSRVKIPDRSPVVRFNRFVTEKITVV